MVGFSLPSIAFFLSALLIFNVHFDEEIHSNSYLMTREYHPNGCARSTHDQHSLAGLFPCTDKHVQWSPAFMLRSFLLIILVPTQRNSFASPSVRSDLFIIVRTQSTYASRSLAGPFSVSVCISRGAAQSYFRSTFCLFFPPEVHTQADDVSPLSRILPVASYAQVVQITVSDSRLTSFVIVKPPQAHRRAILHRTLVLIGCLN